MVTVAAMGRFNGRHLDQRRQLQPRDYLTRADYFGVDPNVQVVVPEGGNEVSLRVAVEQHLLVCRWGEVRRPSSAAVLARRYGTTPSTISAVVTGRRWAGETLFAALNEELRHRHGAGRSLNTKEGNNHD